MVYKSWHDQSKAADKPWAQNEKTNDYLSLVWRLLCTCKKENIYIQGDSKL